MVTATLDLTLPSPVKNAFRVKKTLSSTAAGVEDIRIAPAPASPIPEIVREGLTRTPKTLPPWLFYDQAGSLLFEKITRLQEYYPTRIERKIFAECASEMIALASGDQRLRLVELGAGSADKTRLLLSAAIASQGKVCYQPIDVSETALATALERLEREHPEVTVEPQVADYTHQLRLEPCAKDERRLVLYIGSSIGNFLPEEALRMLSELRSALEPGDSLLLGVDMAPSEDTSNGGKPVADLIAAYDDAKGVTAAFNKNLLTRLNRDLDAEFDLDAFQHRVRWNAEKSRIEMHLESTRKQTVRIASLDLEVDFAEGETIHTENSYKYRLGEVEQLLSGAGFYAPQRWRDENGWFAVYLALRP